MRNFRQNFKTLLEFSTINSYTALKKPLTSIYLMDGSLFGCVSSTDDKDDAAIKGFQIAVMIKPMVASLIFFYNKPYSNGLILT